MLATHRHLKEEVEEEAVGAILDEELGYRGGLPIDARIAYPDPDSSR